MPYNFKQITELTKAGDAERYSASLTGLTPIKQIGIQAFPGAIFYLNDSNFPIVIGKSGIYELEAVNGMEINSIAMDASSYDKINKNSSLSLIIDILGGNG